MILLQIWISVGILPLMWAVRKLIHEEKQISNPDRFTGVMTTTFLD